jgi:hypothetical protein
VTQNTLDIIDLIYRKYSTELAMNYNTVYTILIIPPVCVSASMIVKTSRSISYTSSLCKNIISNMDSPLS